MGSLARPEHFRFEHAARALIAAKRSPNTRRAYGSDLTRWITFCNSEGLDPVVPGLLATTRFRDHLVVALSSESSHRVIAALSSIYRLLLRSGVVPANPFHPSVLAWPVASTIAKTTLVEDKVAIAMIAHAAADTDRKRGARDAALLQMLYDTGLRRASIALVRRVDYRGGALETVVKGAKRVEIALPASSIEALERWLLVAPSSPYLFAGRRGPINLATVNRIVDRHARAVGAGHVHPHSFRAAFITSGYDAELPEYEIQASAHHSDPSTTRRYDRHARGRMVATQIATFRSGRAKP